MCKLTGGILKSQGLYHLTLNKTNYFYNGLSLTVNLLI